MPVTKLLDLCFKHGLLYKGSIENNIQLVKLGSTGSILKENLQKEWFHNMIINRECSVFINTSFQETFNFAKEMCNHYVPFGLAEVMNGNLEDNNVENSANKVQLIQNNVTLRCTTFVSPIEAISYFHQWQRQRKIWWRKVVNINLKYITYNILLDFSITWKIFPY